MSFFTSRGVSEKDLEFILGNIVYPNYMKGITPSNLTYFSNQLNRVVNKFSFTNCEELYNNTFFKAIFDHYVLSGTFEKFTTQDETLMKYREQYISLAQRRAN